MTRNDTFDIPNDSIFPIIRLDHGLVCLMVLLPCHLSAYMEETHDDAYVSQNPSAHATRAQQEQYHSTASQIRYSNSFSFLNHKYERS